MTTAKPTRVLDASVVSDTFDGTLPPVMTVPQGAAFRVNTRSILTHVTPEDLPRFETLGDYAHMNIPVTGPVYIEGVQAGDAVRLDIHQITISETGAMVTIPGRGGFSTRLRAAGKVILIRNKQVEFGHVRLPVRPMIGKIGLGTPQAPHCSTVGSHGGNLDCKDLVAGASLFLPASVHGGQLFLGDLHACQGDGEAALTGVEVEGTVTATATVVPGLRLERPVLVSGGALSTIGDGADLDEAATAALDDMLSVVMAAHGWEREAAAMFISIAADLRVSQVVNPRRSARVTIPLERCPAPQFTLLPEKP